jgi:hypothetical protein
MIIVKFIGSFVTARPKLPTINDNGRLTERLLKKGTEDRRQETK